MNKKIILNSLIFFSFIALSFAYFVEFVLGHEPCNLCKIERIPYIGSIILISFLIFTSKWEKIILSIILLIAVAIVLLLGIGTLFKGGETSKKYSNKLMQLRVLLQFIAIIALIGFAYFFKN